jgi:hypothetical protein
VDKVVDKSVDGKGSRRTAADLSSLARTAAGEVAGRVRSLGTS